MAPSAITGLESDLAEMKITRPEFTREDNVVRAYLLTHSDAFQECDELRERACFHLTSVTEYLSDNAPRYRDGRAQREMQSTRESMP